MLAEYAYRIEIEGKKRLKMEGVTRVLQYSPTLIVLRAARSEFEVSGEGLTVDKIDGDVVAVAGDVKGVIRR